MRLTILSFGALTRWVWPAKIVSEMTCYVSGGTLNVTRSLSA